MCAVRIEPFPNSADRIKLIIDRKIVSGGLSPRIFEGWRRLHAAVHRNNPHPHNEWTSIGEAFLAIPGIGSVDLCPITDAGRSEIVLTKSPQVMWRSIQDQFKELYQRYGLE